MVVLDLNKLETETLKRVEMYFPLKYILDREVMDGVSFVDIMVTDITEDNFFVVASIPLTYIVLSKCGNVPITIKDIYFKICHYDKQSIDDSFIDAIEGVSRLNVMTDIYSSLRGIEFSGVEMYGVEHSRPWFIKSKMHVLRMEDSIVFTDLIAYRKIFKRRLNKTFYIRSTDITFK